LLTCEADPKLTISTERRIRDRVVGAPPIRSLPQQLIPAG
jgi:hypothetical protein